MHPQRDLKTLAARKAALLAELDRSRTEMKVAAAHLRAPLELADRVVLLWRRVASPAGASPAPAPDGRAAAAPHRSTRLGTWLRWLPLIVRATRLVRTAASRRTPRAGQETPGRS